MSGAREAIRVCVTGSCDGLSELRDALEGSSGVTVVASGRTVAEAAGALAGGHLDAVLHGTSSIVTLTEDLAAIREHTNAPVVLLAAGDLTAEALEDAFDAGVADVLLLPQLTQNVVLSLRKVSHAGRRLHAKAGHGRIVTIFSPKGGTGKTVLAVNLACALANGGSKRVLLVDLDLQFGDVAIMLGLEPEKTIYDLVVAPGELDADKVGGYTTKHACGLEVLPAPLRPEDAELVTEAKLNQVLEIARESYDVIVVDTSPFFHGPMLATLDRTDDLLLVCSMDVPAIKNVRLGLQTLELLSFPPERISMLLNRANSNVGIKLAEVERALDVKVDFELPSDRAVAIAVNRGVPVALGDAGSDYARGVGKVAKAIGAGESRPRRRRWLRLGSR